MTEVVHPLMPDANMEALLKTMQGGLVKQSDMIEEIKMEAIDTITSGMEKYPENMEAAAKLIKETMDKKYGPTWHCVCGKGFGFDIEYEQKFLCYMFFGGTYGILLWKSVASG